MATTTNPAGIATSDATGGRGGDGGPGGTGLHVNGGQGGLGAEGGAAEVQSTSAEGRFVKKASIKADAPARSLAIAGAHAGNGVGFPAPGDLSEYRTFSAGGFAVAEPQTDAVAQALLLGGNYNVLGALDRGAEVLALGMLQARAAEDTAATAEFVIDLPEAYSTRELQLAMFFDPRTALGTPVGFGFHVHRVGDDHDLGPASALWWSINDQVTDLGSFGELVTAGELAIVLDLTQ